VRGRCRWRPPGGARLGARPRLPVEQAHKRGCGFWRTPGGAHLGARQWDKRVCELAASRGDLPMLPWARANGCSWREVTFACAAICGQLALLQWAYADGCPLGSLTIAEARKERALLDALAEDGDPAAGARPLTPEDFEAVIVWCAPKAALWTEDKLVSAYTGLARRLKAQRLRGSDDIYNHVDRSIINRCRRDSPRSVSRRARQTETETDRPEGRADTETDGRGPSGLSHAAPSGSRVGAERRCASARLPLDALIHSAENK
jgi:hypothetical protein